MRYIYYPAEGWLLMKIIPPRGPSPILDIIEDSPSEQLPKQPFEQPSRHCVYLLRSLNPRYSRRTYIGYTVNPERRIRQHNGEIVGGAKRTLRGRPWKMVCYIEGFPNQRVGLQYEWINNHPKTKRWHVTGRLKTLAETLLRKQFTKTSPLSRDLNLTVHWLEPGYSLPFNDFGRRRPAYCQEIDSCE